MSSNDLFAFGKIAPYLHEPLVLVGFVIFMAMLLLQTVVKAKAIPVLTKKIGGEIIKTAMRYGFLLSLVVIVFGFSLTFYKTSKNSEPFDFAICLDYDLSKTIPEETGILILRVLKNIDTTRISRNGDAIFKMLPGSLKKESARLKLEMTGWQFIHGKKDTAVAIAAEPILLKIEPDQTYRFIYGHVVDENLRNFPDIRASSSGIEAISDTHGIFQLDFPKALRQPLQELTMEKAGYEVWRDNVKPKSWDTIQILMKLRSH